MDEMNIEQVDQNRYLKECMEAVSLSSESANDKVMENVVIKERSESDWVPKNQMSQGFSPHGKVTSGVGISVRKEGKIVGEESSFKAISTDD